MLNVLQCMDIQKSGSNECCLKNPKVLQNPHIPKCGLSSFGSIAFSLVCLHSISKSNRLCTFATFRNSFSRSKNLMRIAPCESKLFSVRKIKCNLDKRVFLVSETSTLNVSTRLLSERDTNSCCLFTYHFMGLCYLFMHVHCPYFMEVPSNKIKGTLGPTKI